MFDLVNWTVIENQEKEGGEIKTILSRSGIKCSGRANSTESRSPPSPTLVTRWSEPLACFVTLTVDRKLIDGYYKLNPALQHELLFKKFVAYCRRNKLQYYLVPELTEKGNIHFHGIVICDDNKRKLMSSYIRRNIGYKSRVLYPIKDPINNMKYCHKDDLALCSLYPIMTNFSTNLENQPLILSD